MASYTRGDLRQTLSFVKVIAPNLFYGWLTKDFAGDTSLSGIAQSDLTALGHFTATALLSTSGAIAILGANRPKPPRATKLLNANPDASTQGKCSTFYSVGSEGTALAAGWKLGKSLEVVNIKNGARSKTVAVKLTGGGHYAWSMNAADVATYGTELGLILPTSITSNERASLFSGVSRPKPPRVQKEVGTSKFSSFCDPTKLDNLLAAGWSQMDPEIQMNLAVSA